MNNYFFFEIYRVIFHIFLLLIFLSNMLRQLYSCTAPSLQEKGLLSGFTYISSILVFHFLSHYLYFTISREFTQSFCSSFSIYFTISLSIYIYSSFPHLLIHTYASYFKCAILTLHIEANYVLSLFL